MQNFKLENIIRKNILNLEPYSCARDEFKGTEGVFLDANENPFGNLNRYPDPYQTKIKAKLKQLNGVNENMIFVGNGSDEVIDITYRIFCYPGTDKALMFTPTYGMYKVSAQINNIEVIEIPLNKDFQIETTLLAKHLQDTNLKLIFICSPNNPTGNIINTGDIEFILKNFNGIVFVDEAYIDFTASQSLINKLDVYPNLIVSQTLSKSRALAAARIGIAYSSPEIIGYFNKVKPPYNISGPNQKAALETLNNTEEYEKRVTLLIDERKKLEIELKKISIVKKIYPSEANFLLVEFSDANAVYSELINKKIITRNRNSVISNCIRITVGTPEENSELLKALRNFATQNIFHRN